MNLRLGHAGATGTMAWADPETKLLCVILTNRAYSVDDGRLLRLGQRVRLEYENARVVRITIHTLP